MRRFVNLQRKLDLTEFFVTTFFSVVSGDDRATHTIDGDRTDTAEGARVQVHLQPPSSEGKNRSIHPLTVTSSYISPIKIANGESRVIITLFEKALWYSQLLKRMP